MKFREITTRELIFWQVLAIWNHCASPAQRPTGRYTLNLCISPHDLATLTPKCVWRTSAQTWFPVWYIFCPSKLLTRARCVPKGQLYSEWIYEVIVSPKMQTWNCKDFCPTKQTRFVAKKTAYTHKKITKQKCYDPCLFGRAEILVIFGLHFGRNNDLINSFWI